MATQASYDPLTLQALARIEAPDLCPCQVPTSLKLLKNADIHEQAGVKYPKVGTYHNYPEYIHALWLESRREVSSYVPQPFLLGVDHQRYIPDCFVVISGHREVIELKPQGQMIWPEPELVNAFFARERMRFRVVANEEALSHETEALHWRPIIQTLYLANYYGVDTRVQESELLREFALHDIEQVGDLISPLQHGGEDDYLAALYRLIHNHDLEVDLSLRPLDYDTPVVLCV